MPAFLGKWYLCCQAQKAGEKNEMKCLSLMKWNDFILPLLTAAAMALGDFSLRANHPGSSPSFTWENGVSAEKQNKKIFK